jgi:hypothetical protein
VGSIKNLLKNHWARRAHIYMKAFWHNIDSSTLYEIKWKTLFNLYNNFNWKSKYRAPFNCTKNTKLLWLKYRIFNTIVEANKYLVKCKVLNNNKCNLCTTEVESIEHPFFHCHKSKQLQYGLWTQLETLLSCHCKLSHLFITWSHIWLYKGKKLYYQLIDLID